MKKIARNLSGVAALALCASILQACGDGSSDPLSAKAFAASPPAVAAPARAASHWTSAVGDTWQWQLKGKLNTSYNVAIYDIDLFDTDVATIAALKQAGRKVVCYFSAGSSENWRPDFSKFKASDQGNKLDDWEGERWLDIRSSNVREIMTARLDRAVAKGCDGVEPDNVDGYANDTGFPLQDTDQYAFNVFIANEAHKRNLAVGLKNDVDQLVALEPSFDFAVNEECNEQKECDGYTVFTSKSKPVLNAEYAGKYRTSSGQRTLCNAARALNMRTLVLAKKLDDSYRFSCDGA
ncbi:endo alpha-1,4 polygalactosaminidase [Burkholderia cenocepacia]|uniref:endo alpha-1,4 polygalactosaminidase n=1 Tax=Burkholderia cenocepacia TaxID=95486 RepID=UPI0020186949|nr:endo alpha-1,4 polygalactosaminidase [Burkholderia cenocepacia]MCO1394971.1 endo alpha-1,4 polygalactosaminidase [Burkholderia cenocepacia]MCO1407675.1 endo alpha-1,4 polygalactosaminidase [Burkholderia cenocepacia]UQN91489.1 endo alpha-1,4 polygalactosaminidase [Burkholderia cenocepacia]UQN98303.1 endo alpha-1,4 polygalactosaminidase [Burkholderia cenocepacia]UQP48082.1 endo alpha-1,4 polygalactosaminidase [Burkholderia cenocepacia]